jgi:hypothetical protein
MQSLAFLWFQLQMTQQNLQEKMGSPEPVPGNAANLESPTGMATVRRPSANQVARIEPARKPRASVTASQNSFRLIGSRFGRFGRSQAETRRSAGGHSR